MMMKKFYLILCISIFCLISISISSSSYEDKGSQPIINKKLALQIGELILDNKYGNTMKKEKPLSIIDHDSAWFIHGNLPKNFLGGEGYIEIDKRNCKILRLGHSK